MNRTLYVEGMTCSHCKKRVEDALNAIDGVKAEVNLKKNVAEISLSKAVEDETLKKAVEEAGYRIISEGRK
ncbi:MAG: cation transporter [Endomicrobium sp.]|nr:cation transporter [Endomicrobium sp.]